MFTALTAGKLTFRNLRVLGLTKRTIGNSSPTLMTWSN